MLIISVILLIVTAIGYWYVVNRLLFKNRQYNVDNELRSIKVLGVFTKLNVWPTIIGINNWGVYLIQTSWHGLKQKKQFFPIETVVLIRVIEYAGLFGKIEILLRLNSMQNEFIELPQFYSIDKCNLFYKYWLIAQRTMYHS